MKFSIFTGEKISVYCMGKFSLCDKKTIIFYSVESEIARSYARLQTASHQQNQIQQSQQISYVKCKLLIMIEQILVETYTEIHKNVQVGKDQEMAQSEKRFPLQLLRWEKNKLTIRYFYHETHRKPNEQLFSQ